MRKQWILALMAAMLLHTGAQAQENPAPKKKVKIVVSQNGETKTYERDIDGNVEDVLKKDPELQNIPADVINRVQLYMDAAGQPKDVLIGRSIQGPTLLTDSTRKASRIKIITQKDGKTEVIERQLDGHLSPEDQRKMWEEAFQQVPEHLRKSMPTPFSFHFSTDSLISISPNSFKTFSFIDGTTTDSSFAKGQMRVFAFPDGRADILTLPSGCTTPDSSFAKGQMRVFAFPDGRADVLKLSSGKIDDAAIDSLLRSIMPEIKNQEGVQVIQIGPDSKKMILIDPDKAGLDEDIRIERSEEGNHRVIRIVARKVSLHNVTSKDELPENLRKDSFNDLQGLESLLYYPNPNNGIFTIEFELKKKSPVALAIYDQSGQIVWQEQVDTFDGKYKKQVDLSAQPKGQYILRITQGRRAQTKHLRID